MTRAMLRLMLVLGGAAISVPALAQSAKDNALEDAEDAFGGSVGLENIGIYSATNVRGFDPQKAGNARIDGVYFDQLSSIGSRAKESSTIRVGFAALDSFAPSPTGIVAYKFHQADDEFVTTLGLASTAYGESIDSILFKIPVIAQHFSIATGVAYAGQKWADGSRSDNYGYGFLPRLRFKGIELRAVFSGYLVSPDTVRPVTSVTGPFLPRVPGRTKFLGQDWADGKNVKITNGLTMRADIAEGLRFRGGVFRSRWDFKKKYTEVYRVVNTQGDAKHFLLADPKQDTFSNSWEGLFSYRVGDQRASHTLYVGARGRFRHIESGGSDFIDFTPGDETIHYGERDARAKPQLDFGPVNLGRLRQVAYTVGYIGKLKDVGQINLGLNKTDYDASFTNQIGTTHSKANPWLYNASMVVQPAHWLSFYAGIVTGLEDNGSAPESAANRGEQLPAVKTKQIDGGVQVKIGQATLVGSLFQIEKPYFALDSVNRFTSLGDVRHRGGEISFTGHLTKRLHVLAGAVIMDPVVTGNATTLGLVGKRPVGTPKIHGRIDLAYQTDLFHGLTFTAAMAHDSKRAASSQTYAALGGRQLFLPSRTTFDIGARHKFKVNNIPTSLRFVIENVTDKKSWDTIAGNSFFPGERRRWSLYLIADF